MVQNAIAKSKIPVNTLGYSVVFHVPASKFSDAKPHIHQLIEPFGGFNASLRNVGCFTATFNRHFAAVLFDGKSFGRKCDRSGNSHQ